MFSYSDRGPSIYRRPNNQISWITCKVIDHCVLATDLFFPYLNHDSGFLSVDVTFEDGVRSSERKIMKTGAQIFLTLTTLKCFH